MNLAAEKMSYDPAAVPAELLAMLESLGEFFGLEAAAGKPGELKFERIAENSDEVISEVEFNDNGGALIRYNTISAAARGIGSALAGIAGRQSTPFTMLGVMLDFSRNIVFTLPMLEKVFRRLALLGFNTVFLYCEDTYELPDEPAFGMMRGRYTAEEVRAMDDMAAKVGIELIGCIQTLGHMGQVLRWRYTYGKITDTSSVMMVENEKTHKLIGKMLDFWRDNLRSRRIHVGMDETHDLGRGRYMDQKGFTPPFELFTNHLNQVVKACSQRGLKPMIWSDMFFRLGNPEQAYYDLDSKIPESVRKAIPREVELVYWDYYNVDQDFYEKFIDMHRELGGEPLMGAGVWIWSRLWYDHIHGSIANRACINGCRSKKLKEIFFTMWGDDGAICHWDSAWTGLTEAADLAYGVDNADITAQRYKALTNGDYFINQLPGLLHRATDLSGKEFDVKSCHNSDLAIFWDDILLGLGYRNLRVMDKNLPDRMIADFSAIVEKLTPYRGDRSGGNLEYGYLISKLLRDKLLCRQELERAYFAGDKAALKALADEKLPELAALMDEVMKEFRKQWLDAAKVFGLETMQHRMGGVKERIYEASLRINEYVAGVYDKLEELEAPLQDVPERMMIYCDIASGSIYV